MLGTGKIDGGTKVTVNRLRYELDCVGNSAGIGCPDAGDIFTYLGDTTIVTDCPTGWSSNAPLGGNVPNEIVFTASTAFDIPPYASPFCSLQFGVGLDKTEPFTPPGVDGRPRFAEVVAGFSAVGADAECDNGLVSPTAEVVGIQLADASSPSPVESRKVRVRQRSGKEVPRAALRRWDTPTAAAHPWWSAPHGLRPSARLGAQ
jgi:hypothetical protein